MKCKTCGKNMIVKMNKDLNKKFLGCPNFPHCKCSSSIVDIDKNMKNIDYILDKFEVNILVDLELFNGKYDLRHVCSKEMNCDKISELKIISDRNYEIHWNIEQEVTVLTKYIKELAYQLRLVYQSYNGLPNSKEDAVNYSRNYLDNLVRNIKL